MGDYLIFGGGAVVGAIGSLIFISHSLHTPSGDGAQSKDQDRLRRSALSATLGVYEALALVATAVALALGAITLAIIAATIMLVAGAGLIVVWGSRSDSAGASASADFIPL